MKRETQEASDLARPMGLADRTLYGVIWVIFGAWAQIIIKIIVLMVLARVLTPTEFGLVALSTLVSTVALMACRFGFGPALVQIHELTSAHVKAALSLSIVISSIVAGGLVLVAPSLSAFFDQPELTWLLYVNAAVPLMLGISQIPESLLQRDLQFKKLTLIDGTSFVFGYGAVSISLALLDFGAVSLVLGVVAQEIIRTILLFTTRFVVPGLAFGLMQMRDLAGFGFKLWMVQTTNTAAYQIDNFVVSKFLGIQALGLYSRAYQVVTIPTKLIGNSLLKALFPAMSRIQNENDQMAKALRQVLGGTTLITLPLSMFVFVYAREIIYVILGDQWSSITEPFRVLSIAILFRVGHKVCDSVIRAKGAVFRLWLRQSFYAISVLAFSYVGHFYGLTGVAIGVLLACAINFILLFHLALNLLQQPRYSLYGAMFRQVLTTVPFTVFIWVLAIQLRSANVGAVFVLISGLLMAVITFGILLWRYPGVFGDDGVYLAHTFAKLWRRIRSKSRPDKQEKAF